MSTLIWLTDLHFLAQGDVLGHDPRARLAAAIQQINDNHSDADLCVISGDLVDQATPKDYAALSEMLNELKVPFQVMVGNHDNRDLLKKAFTLPDNCMADFVQFHVDVPKIRLLCLDTLESGADAGAFCTARLAWLQDQLISAPDMPTILFMHHPPMPLGLPMQDVEILENGSEFLDLVARFRNIRHLCIGHVHRPVSGMIRGIPFSTMRSTLYQAPPPQPKWDWSGFSPSDEAPCFGRIEIGDAGINLHHLQFCAAAYGRHDDITAQSQNA